MSAALMSERLHLNSNFTAEKEKQNRQILKLQALSEASSYFLSGLVAFGGLSLCFLETISWN